MSKKAVAKNYLAKLRNIGIIAHIDAGKTTLTERILFYTHKIHRMGEVHEGTATMDFMPEEQERGITITSACTTCVWNDKTINIIDTPGHVDFTIEVERSLRVLDGAVGVFCAVGGVEPQSETVWRQSEKFHVPKLAFVNKMDRLGADFEAVLDAMRTKLKANPLALQIPVGQGQDFEAVIDLVTMERLEFDPEDQGAAYRRLPLEGKDADMAGPWRETLLETLAETDDALLEQYLGGEAIAVADVRAAIRKATVAMQLVPVLCGSALKNAGVQPVLDAVCDYLPSPEDAAPAVAVLKATREKRTLPPSWKEPLAALVFKVTMETGRKLALMRLYSGALGEGDAVMNVTQDKEERVARLFRMHAGHKEKVDQALAGEIVAAAGMKFARTGDTLLAPAQDGRAPDPLLLESIASYKPVISLALEPKNKEEGDKLDEILEKFLLEDPTLFNEVDKDTGQRIISGMGELHLEVVLGRMRREYGVAPRTGNPQVVYQETVSAKGAGSGEFHRELGDDMHYGKVALTIEPLPRNGGNKVHFEVDTTAWPAAWIDAVAHGVQDSMQSGVLKGYPVQDVLVTVTGMERLDASSPVGYQMACVGAFREAMAAAKPVLLEPIMSVEVSVPDEFVGDAIGLLGSKGAKVENMFDRAGQKTVQALAPMRRLFGFSTSLRSATQGRAGLVLTFARFDVLE
ncbi:MAG: elongation factor G [Desulfovibrionaceae bacterium]